VVRHTLKRAVAATTICAMAVAGMYIPQNDAKAAEVVDTSDWQKSIVVDFGVTSDLDEEGNQIPGLCEDSQIQFKQVFSEVETAVPVEGRGNWLYENTTIQDVYGTTALVKQKMGFDKVMPAGITSTGGNYFKDWVFSPNGEEYSFSVDLPVGQYYVAVYTGNKVKNYDNTTLVRFNDESFMMGETEFPVVYDQTSAGGSQFYGETEKEFVYVVDVKDNGQGYGTLKATFFDNTDYEASHNLTVGDVYHVPAEGEEAKAHGVKSLDLYEGTEAEISKEAISDKLITARLNGFEIMPVEEIIEPNHDAGKGGVREREVEFGYTGSLYEAEPDWVITDRSYYISSDPSVVSVNKYTGEISALKAGKATVYDYNAYLDAVVASTITVIPASFAELDKKKITLKMGGIEGENKTSLTLTFNNAAEDAVEWSIEPLEESTEAEMGSVKISEPVCTSEGVNKISTVELEAVKMGHLKVVATIKKDDGRTFTAKCTVSVVNAIKEEEPIQTPTPTTDPTATPNPVLTPGQNDSTVNPGQTNAPLDNITVTPDKNHVCIYMVKVDGKKTTTLKVKKSVKYNVKAFGPKVKKVKCTVKSGKKFVTVKATKKSIKVKARKHGKVKLVIKVTTTNNRTFKFNRTIKIK